MERIKVFSEPLTAFSSVGVTTSLPLDPETEPPRRLRSGGSAALAIISLEPRGCVGGHAAVGNQLMVVLSGDVKVAAGDPENPVSIQLGAGQAVRFTRGEWHESRSLAGAILVVLEE